MVFYKPKTNEFFFQLVNIDVKEDFALWDNINKRFIRQVDGVRDMNDLKFMKQDLFQQRYPNLRKNTQYIRDIVVHENQQVIQYQFGFKKTANDKIVTAISNCRTLGTDVREVMFKQRKTGTGISTEYEIIMLEKVGLPKNIVLPEFQQADAQYNITPLESPVTPLKSPTIANPQQESIKPLSLGLVVKTTPELVLNDMEKTILGWFNESKEVYGEEQFIEIWNATVKQHFNTIQSIERIKRIFILYKKQ